MICTYSPSPLFPTNEQQVTSHVVKFMKNGDVKYKEMFVKKMKQLAKGERSHKLQKPLKGCESIICEYRSFCLDISTCNCLTHLLIILFIDESYLENKGGGFRILWTEEGDRIVVWFIAKHKVSLQFSIVVTVLSICI